MHFLRRRLFWLFILLAPFTRDAKLVRAVGLGGLRRNARKDCLRPFSLMPDIILDPVHVIDYTARPVEVVWDRQLSEYIDASKVHQDLKRIQKQQYDIFREAISVKRNARQAALFRTELAERRAHKRATRRALPQGSEGNHG